jgi:predicted ATPase
MAVETEGPALFASIAGHVQPRFALDAASAPLVEQICARLGGMPLAIELAAGWADTLSVSEIAGTNT